MKKFTLLLVGFSLCRFLAIAQGFSTNLLFVAKLEGEQEVPPVATTAIGEASFSLNATRDTICVNVTTKGLSGPITGAHIHEGHIGGSGGIVIDLSGFVVNNRITATITAPALNNIFLATLMKGDYYINVHTAANPNGEIRGQIELESDWPFMANLDGAQETPAVATNATGIATFDLSKSMRSLTIRGIFENLSGPITAAHLHLGAPGVSGGILIDLMSGVNGNQLELNVDPDTFAYQILRGNVYINIHTGVNSNGEIRGQLIKQGPLSLDAKLNGAQEVPSVGTSAFGTGMMTFNPSRDSLWYDFMVTGLSSAITNAHFHTGAFGVAGGVAIDISGSLSGNRLHGVVAGSNIPSTFFDDCLLGNIYVNVHTANNGNGEIRGQMMRYPREGFTFSIDANQETPPTNSSAMGSGMASIDRDAENLHFRMIVSGLTGPVMNAHFHNAAVGSPGLVIFDLTPYFTLTGTDDGAFNYWMKPAGFDSTKVPLFLNNEVYVNVHTAAFPNGEVRGQVTRGGSCYNLNIGINTVEPMALGFNIYPNPFSENLHLSFAGLVNGNGKITITDVSSRIVSEKNVNVVKGENDFVLDDNYQPGIYLVRIQIENKDQLISRIVKSE